MSHRILLELAAVQPGHQLSIHMPSSSIEGISETFQEQRKGSGETTLPTYEQSDARERERSGERDLSDYEPEAADAPETSDRSVKQAGTVALPSRNRLNEEKRLAVAETLNQEFESFRTVASALSKVMERVEDQDPSVEPLLQTSFTESGSHLVEVGMALPRQGCPPNCKCSCHLRTKSSFRFQLPELVTGVLGSLFVGYSGYPIASNRCTISQCSRARSLALQVHYIFPQWFLSIALRASIQMSAIGGLSVGVIVKHRIPFTPSIVTTAQYGSLRELRTFFTSDKVRIDAVDDLSGRSALHYAMYSLTVDVPRVHMLLQLGSDPDHEDDLGESVRHIVARKVLSGSDDKETLNQLELLCPISKAISDFEFNFLHKVVVGVCPVNLGTVLQSADRNIYAQLDGRDNLGKTPLHWAVARQDMWAIRVLLDAGANINLYTHKGHTSLMESLVWQEDPECAFAIMGAGVDLYNKDLDGFLPFHHAVCFNRLPVVAKMLEMGVDIEARSTSHGETGLLMAARRNLVSVARYLIDQGAEINAKDDHGFTPLLRAVDSNSHGTLRLLLEAGADKSTTTALGKTVLHVAATRGNAETLRILGTSSLAGLDASAVDSQGQTAMDRFTAENPDSEDVIVEGILRTLLKQAEEIASSEATDFPEEQSDSDSSSQDEFFDPL